MDVPTTQSASAEIPAGNGSVGVSAGLDEPHDMPVTGEPELSDCFTQIVGGLISGAVGFTSAYLLARRQRHWDAEDAAAAARVGLMKAARIPLEIIRDEIRINQGFYYTRDVEERISRALREAIYPLRDEPLIREFEKATLPLRELAWGSDRESSGEKCSPHIEAMLKRIGELETATTRDDGDGELLHD